jgi:hypothetical protein
MLSAAASWWLLFIGLSIDGKGQSSANHQSQNIYLDHYDITSLS